MPNLRPGGSALRFRGIGFVCRRAVSCVMESHHASSQRQLLQSIQDIKPTSHHIAHCCRSVAGGRKVTPGVGAGDVIQWVWEVSSCCLRGVGI